MNSIELHREFLNFQIAWFLVVSWWPRGIFCDPIPTPPRHHQGPFKCESGRGYEGTECECTMDICKEFGTLSQNILLYCLYCKMKNEMLSRINSPQQNKQKLIFSGGQRLATARNILGILYLVIPGWSWSYLLLSPIWSLEHFWECWTCEGY